MSVTQEQIEKLSKKLSKIALDDPKLWSDINEILQYMELLNEVDTSDVEPTINVVQRENNLRKDEVITNNDSKSLLNCSKQKVVADQIAISNIMK